MSLTAATGRGLFAFIFIASAVNKCVRDDASTSTRSRFEWDGILEDSRARLDANDRWQSLRQGADAALMTSVTPALRIVKHAIATKAGFDLCALLPSDYALVRAATALELLGAALFAAGFAIGAKFLILFILIVTPVMHPFWMHASEAAIGNDAALGVEMIMFFKNVSLLGALVMFLGMHANEAEMREKFKKRD